MNNKSCFFIGHASTSDEILPVLRSAIETEIVSNGINEFYVGYHGRFDALVTRALREAKQRHPQIRCYLVTAYHPGVTKLEIPPEFNGIYYPFERSVPARYALPKANRAMIDQCTTLIAAVYSPGRSRDVLEYAQRKSIRIVNLSEK